MLANPHATRNAPMSLGNAPLETGQACDQMQALPTGLRTIAGNAWNTDQTRLAMIEDLPARAG